MECINGCGPTEKVTKTKSYKGYNLDYEEFVCKKCGAKMGTVEMAAALQNKVKLVDEWERKINKDIICK